MFGIRRPDNFNDIALVHSLGLVFLTKIVDTDGDGVKDKDDVEPNTLLELRLISR
jgi:hypothetical protein